MSSDGLPLRLAPSRSLALLALAGFLLTPLPSMAAEETPNYAADTLSGDWGGLRRAMFEQGLALDLLYKNDLLHNMSGGLARGGRPMTHLDIRLKADFEKLINWSGGSGYINLIDNRGDRFNTHQVGSLTGVSNIEVPVSTHRLLHAWLQQEFADARGSVLAGLYPIDSEFQVLDSAGVFLQPPYGASADIALTRAPSIFNNSSFAIRGRWLSADRAAYVQGAVLDGVPGDPEHPQGTHIRFAKGDGVMSIVEIGLKPGAAGEGAAADKAAAADAGERIEKYAAGYWRYSTPAADQLDTQADGSPINRRRWGWYALAERTLQQTSGGGDLAAFVRLSGTDGDSTAIKRALNIGVRAKGLLAGRGDDVLGLAYTRAYLSGKWRSGQSLLGSPTSANEGAWELTYRIQARKWLALQPVFQRIDHPGGDRSRAAAMILGARLEIAL